MHSHCSCTWQVSLLPIGKLPESKDVRKYLKPLTLTTKVLLQFLLHFSADHCYHFKNLSYANRKISYVTLYGSGLCDSQLPQGCYRFVGAADTKMPTTRVTVYRCGADWSGWLADAHPTVEDGKVKTKVCFSYRSTGCKYVITISVVDHTSSTNFTHLLVTHPTVVQTKWKAKKKSVNKRTHKLIPRYTYFRDFVKPSFYGYH